MTSNERSGFLPGRTIHLHATQRCNLACKHCYSFSSPQSVEKLDLDVVSNCLSLLRKEGYSTLSLSGGEPFLYPDFSALLEQARALGYRIIAVTNGVRIRPKYRPLLDQIDGLAVSFDGLEDLHNEIRSHPGAFAMAVRALDYLKEIGKPAALAYTVSRRSLATIPEIAELAGDKEVRSLQLRPLVSAGRAKQECTNDFLSRDDLNRLYLIGASLRTAYAGRPSIHTDLVHSEEIAAHRQAYGSALDDDPVSQPLSSLVNPLVITTKGIMKPFTFDFPDKFDLGHIADLKPNSLDAIKASRYRPFQKLLRDVFVVLARTDRFIDWFAYCRDFAADSDAVSAV